MKRRTQQSRASHGSAPAKESGPAPVAVNPARPVTGNSQPSAGNHQAAEIAPPFVPGLTTEVQPSASAAVAGVAGHAGAETPHEPINAHVS